MNEFVAINEPVKVLARVGYGYVIAVADPVDGQEGRCMYRPDIQYVSEPLPLILLDLRDAKTWVDFDGSPFAESAILAEARSLLVDRVRRDKTLKTEG